MFPLLFSLIPGLSVYSEKFSSNSDGSGKHENIMVPDDSKVGGRARAVLCDPTHPSDKPVVVGQAIE